MGIHTLRAACALTLLCATVTAQNVSGTLSGSIQDSTGAAIPSIEVTLSSDRTGFLRATRTNESGLFTFPDLTPTAYTLKINTPGFNKYEQTNIEITSGSQRSLGAIELKIGQTSESVTVTVEAEAVALGSSEKAGTLSAADIEAMALKGRDIMDAMISDQDLAHIVKL